MSNWLSRSLYIDIFLAFMNLKFFRFKQKIRFHRLQRRQIKREAKLLTEKHDKDKKLFFCVQGHYKSTWNLCQYVFSKIHEWNRVSNIQHSTNSLLYWLDDHQYLLTKHDTTSTRCQYWFNHDKVKYEYLLQFNQCVWNYIRRLMLS